MNLEEVGFLLDQTRRDDQHVYYQLQKEAGMPLNFPVMVASMRPR